MVLDDLEMGRVSLVGLIVGLGFEVRDERKVEVSLAQPGIVPELVPLDLRNLRR